MFDLGWTELLLIGIVALIVVGPKDLPGMFRAVGQFVGKAKGMAREFSKAMNDAADESGVRDISDTLKKATNPVGSAMSELRKSTDSFTKKTMDSGKPKDKPAPGTAKPAAGTEAPKTAPAPETPAAPAAAAKTKSAAKTAAKPAAKTKAAAKPKAAPKAAAKATTGAKTGKAAKPAARKAPAKPKAEAAKPAKPAARKAKPAAEDKA